MPWIEKYRRVVCTNCLGKRGWWYRGGKNGRQTLWENCESCMGMGSWDVPYQVWISKKELEKLQKEQEENDE